MLTKKNKIQFEEWLSDGRWFDTLPIKLGLTRFNRLPFEMQIGVYLAYYDSLVLDIEIGRFDTDEDSTLLDYFTILLSYKNEIKHLEGKDTRNEAYKEAFKMANKLINEQI